MTTKEYEVTVSLSGEVTFMLSAEDEAEATSSATERVGTTLNKVLSEELSTETKSIAVMLESVDESREG